MSSICKGSSKGKNDRVKIPKILLHQSNGEASISKVDLLHRIMFITFRATNLWDNTAVFKSFEDPKS